MRPSPETLAWVERSVGPGARVVGWRRLTGGITSAIHRVTVDGATGRRELVLRRWLRDLVPFDADFAAFVEREAAVLTGLAGTGLPAPRLVAASPSGGEAGGAPALLMTRLPGRMLLEPTDDWLRQIAALLPRIHASAVAAPAWEPWIDVASLTVPAWTSRPDVWRAAVELVRDGRPRDATTSFIHRDFQHFNLLWSRARLCGVVDWTSAAVGPRDLDAGHCRLNLAVLFSAEHAERFRAAYEAEAGRAVDPWWDVHALFSYDPSWRGFIPLQVGGRAPLDLAGMDDRVEALLAAALRRAGGDRR